MLGGKLLMNKLFKTLALGLMLMVFAVTSATMTFAQDQTAEKQALYKKYTDNFEKPDKASKQIALDAAKEYIAKYNTEVDKPQVDYFKEAIPVLEKSIKDIDIAAEKNRIKEQQTALYNRFNTAVEGKNLSETFAAGKQITASEPEFLDVHIVLATMGYDESIKKNNTYNNDAIEAAKKAIQLIESGKTSNTYGAYSYAYKTKEFSTPEQAKNNALGWLNFSIGSILYFNQDKKKEALPYFYKATQIESGVKKVPAPYRTIGDYFTAEVARIDKERTAKIAANNNEDNEETLALLALEKAYADRAMDAYARAYKIASNTPGETKEYKDALYTLLKNLYNFRYNNTTGLDAYVAGVMNKPMPNPTTEVTPVVEQTTTTTTTTSTTTPTTPSTKPSTTTTSTQQTTKTSVTAKTDGDAPATKTADKKPLNKNQRKRQ